MSTQDPVLLCPACGAFWADSGDAEEVCDACDAEARLVAVDVTHAEAVRIARWRYAHGFKQGGEQDWWREGMDDPEADQ